MGCVSTRGTFQGCSLCGHLQDAEAYAYKVTHLFEKGRLSIIHDLQVVGFRASATPFGSTLIPILERIDSQLNLYKEHEGGEPLLNGPQEKLFHLSKGVERTVLTVELHSEASSRSTVLLY